MNIEIERRWLVDPTMLPENYLELPCESLSQGYLTANNTFPVVRVRVIDRNGTERALQTVKSPYSETLATETPCPAPLASRCLEIEFEIPLEQAKALMSVRLAGLDKTRFFMPGPAALTIELDVFTTPALKGLVIAEIELPNSHTTFEVPDWFGPEVTGVSALSNIALANDPAKGIAAAREAWAAF